MLAKKHPELEKPVQIVKYMSLRESLQFAKFRRDINALDEASEKDNIRQEKEQARIDGRAEGRAEGHAEGHAEGLAVGLAEKLEIARKLKSKGLPMAEIIEITNISTEAAEKLFS